MFRAVREGWFGELMEIDAMMGKKAGADMRRQLAEFSGGGFFELACHILDAAVYLMGRPLKVHGLPGARVRVTVTLLQIINWRCSSILRARLVCAAITPIRLVSAAALSVAGTRGGWKFSHWRAVVVLNPRPGTREIQKGSQTVQLKSGRSYTAEFADLARVIRGEKAGVEL